LRRATKGLLVFGVIFIITGLILATIRPALSSDELTWSVEVGDEFEYWISVSGHNYSEYGSQLSAIVLNQRQIIFEVISLPTIPAQIDADSFAEFMQELKAEYRFEDEQDVLSSTADLLTDAFSFSLLPIGNWYLLDSLYEDNSRGVYESQIDNYVLSSLEGQSFYITYESCSYPGGYYHGGYRWIGEVNLATGVPLTVAVLESFSYQPEPFYELEIVLTRV
jgi:hypothetical protein